MQQNRSEQKARRAVRLFESGDFGAAARLLVSLLAHIPPDPTLLRLCGMALLRTGDPAKALFYLTRARRLAPSDLLAALWLGIAQHAAERFTEAAITLENAVALSPSDPAPLVHLARTLLKLDRPAESVATAQAAIRLAPSQLEAWQILRLAQLASVSASGAQGNALAEAWLALGSICLRMGAVQDARAAMQQAIEAAPDHADIAAHLANVEHLCGEPLTAIARLNATLGSHPDHALTNLHLATQMIMGGDPSAALGILEGPPPPPPLRAFWDAYLIDALIRLGRHQDAHAVLAQVMEPIGDAEILLRWQHSLLARHGGDHRLAASLAGRTAELAADPRAARLDHRIDAHFAIAGLLHAEKKHEQAFAHWTAGHTMLRSAQPFSRRQHETFVETIIRTYDRDRVLGGARAANSDRSPVFIVGLPRTGTTLTEHILAAHADIHGAGERLAIRELIQDLTQTSDATLAIARASVLDSGTLTEAASGYLATLHALSPDSPIILDKMPDNFPYLGFIATVLPGARFIGCTRDLRDVGASIFQQRFIGYHPYAHDLGDLGWTMAQHHRLMRHWRSTFGPSMIEIDHNDWIADFDKTLDRALSFLGLPHDPACVRFHEQDRIVRTASRDQVRQPINARGVGRWQVYEAQLGPMMEALARD